MKKSSFNLLLMVVALFALCADVSCFAEETKSEKVLGLERIVTTCYALGGDESPGKPVQEGVYLAKGKTKEALFALKGIILEARKSPTTFRMKDEINVIVYRGSMQKLGKIEIKKVVFKDPASSFDIFAEYSDFPNSDIASQPAAIIPIGQLPPGRYAVNLFLNNKLHNQIRFIVSK